MVAAAMKVRYKLIEKIPWIRKWKKISSCVEIDNIFYNVDVQPNL